MSAYIKNIIHTFNRQFFSLIIGVFTTVVIARYLGVENRGLYALIILLPTTIFTFLNLGFNSSIIYFIGKKKYKLEDIIQSIKLVVIILVPFALIISLFIIVYFHDIFFKGVAYNYLYFSLFFIPTLIFSSFLQAIFIGHENFKYLNNILLLQPILFLIFISLNLFFDYKLEGIMLAELFSHYIILAIIYYFFKKIYDKKKGKSSKLLIYEKLRYGLKNHVANMISFFEYRLDLLMVSYYLDLKSVGAYVIAVNLAEKLWMISSTVSSVMFARVVNVENSIEKIFITNLSAKIVFIISSIIAIILYYLSNYLIAFLFGKEYIESILPFIYLLPGIVFWSVVKIHASYIAAEGKPEYNIYVSFFSILINLSLNIILIPKLGLSGAAIATSISYIINFLLRLIVFTWMAQISLFEVVFFTRKEINTFLFYISKKKGFTNEK